MDSSKIENKKNMLLTTRDYEIKEDVFNENYFRESPTEERSQDQKIIKEQK